MEESHKDLTITKRSHLSLVSIIHQPRLLDNNYTDFNLTQKKDPPKIKIKIQTNQQDAIGSQIDSM